MYILSEVDVIWVKTSVDMTTGININTKGLAKPTVDYRIIANMYISFNREMGQIC